MAAEQPPISSYGLIAEGRSVALVSAAGSIDWCCLPRFDSGALFARLLDPAGGHCSIESERVLGRRYLERTLVLETRLGGTDGEARLLDFFVSAEDEERPCLVRIVEGVRGSVKLKAEVVPRFDYGAVAPWLRRAGGDNSFAAIGGDDGLLIRADFELRVVDRHRLEGELEVGEGERRRLSLGYRRPVDLEPLDRFEGLDPDRVDGALERAVERWRQWFSRLGGDALSFDGVGRSAAVLKALSYEPTGAIVAAPTTSLPEARELSGERNWDYRFSWVRDSALAAHSLAELGCEEDADAFRRFVERSAAGHADDLQVLFGVGGERRLGEEELEHLSGYRGAVPARVGNGAAAQFQLDAYGQILDQSWSWHRRGNSPDDDYWRFLADLVDAAARRWQEPDRGIWEWRGEPRHFVHSKALAWSALDRGIRIAEDTGREAPERWPGAREEIRAAILSRGYEERRGTFVGAFDGEDLDAALLRLPAAGFLDWDDERMMGTADAIREKLDCDGLLRRYEADDGLAEEGAFLPCSFWLATCLARQGRREDAHQVFERASATANDLGLYSEEYDPAQGRMLGNFPQALTHLSHIEAAIALTRPPDRAKP
ncbi:MAG TPA: glycoside hydrolase family 15 protein [Solirubrobacterales bacterium]|jgi:GH15 family glucan-1,4-alpha-glucosidase|nr:glycoside hydrolase family 15 protein [Solirubrobacterales bacterium]